MDLFHDSKRQIRELFLLRLAILPTETRGAAPIPLRQATRVFISLISDQFCQNGNNEDDDMGLDPRSGTIDPRAGSSLVIGVSGWGT